jgi:hypothetical protein
MIRGFAKRISLVTALGALTFAAGAGAGDIRLPDMGSPADAILSNTDEARLGRMIMRNVRNSGQVVEDPLITEYLNDVGSRIAAQTNDGAHSFTFFAVDDERINAFALPGGYIGVHTGLLRGHGARSRACDPTPYCEGHTRQLAAEHPDHGDDAWRDHRRGGRREFGCRPGCDGRRPGNGGPTADQLHAK